MSIEIKLFLISLTAFTVTYLMTPIAIKIAHHVNALDKPNDRKVHKKSIPRLGGLAMYFGFLVSFLIFGVQDQTLTAILISSFVIIITGIVDDIKPLPASIKFSGQLMAALILMIYGNLYIEQISAFGFTVNFNLFMYPLTMFFILGAINAINIIDGLDGLAGGISGIFFTNIAVIAFLFGRTSGIDVTLALIMVGVCFGFLIHNFYPASIFMGDSGSMFLGLIIAAISLTGYKNVTFTSLIVPLILLAIPILDTSFAIIRRIIKKKKISEADKEHLHHQLLALTNSQRKTVLYIYFFNILFALALILFLIKDRTLGTITYILITVIVLWLVMKTSIVKDFNKTKKSKLKNRN